MFIPNLIVLIMFKYLIGQSNYTEELCEFKLLKLRWCLKDIRVIDLRLYLVISLPIILEIIWPSGFHVSFLME